MRKWLTALMVICSIGLTGVVGYLYTQLDREAPEIHFKEDKVREYSSDMTKEELLEGVEAVDNRDGDVSGALAVEKVYTQENGKVVVMYAAKDASNNVVKEEFIMECKEDTSEEEKQEEESEDMTEEDSETEEPDVTEITPTPTEEILTDEELAKRTQEDKINQLPLGAPQFRLTTYYLKVGVGASVDWLSYVADITDDKDDVSVLYRTIQLIGDADLYVPGTYEKTYYVIDSEGNMSNQAVLTVVVE